MTAPLLELRTVRKDFALGQGLFAKRRILTALDGIDLSIAPGETLVWSGSASPCSLATLRDRSPYYRLPQSRTLPLPFLIFSSPVMTQNYLILMALW
ncbi:hypothetical protein [Thalassobaculum salexigens]|uniref:hypothetical protein n=1 Tax=Thalassobaculum salexigens TaxID=455360 RepID=UPI00248EFF30|nr:hypothetical protein [Thalassobaculum salexigens]